MRAQGAGGQHVNKTKSAIRITHLPTGIVVFVQEDRSQHKNKAKALALLRTKLYDTERTRLDSARAADRKGQVGSGDRSERIRTYNFPQGRVTDHRINLTLYKLPEVIEGEALGELVDALVAENQAALLAARTTQHECRGSAMAPGGRPTSQARAILTSLLEQAGIDLPALDARLLIGMRCISITPRWRPRPRTPCRPASARRLRSSPREDLPVSRSRAFWVNANSGACRSRCRRQRWCRGRRPRRSSNQRSTCSAKRRDEPLRIADLGTGTGALLLALLQRIAERHRRRHRSRRTAHCKPAQANADALGLSSTRAIPAHGFRRRPDPALRSRGVEPALYRDTARLRRSHGKCATTIRSSRSTAARTGSMPIGPSQDRCGSLLTAGTAVLEIGIGQAARSRRFSIGPACV